MSQYYVIPESEHNNFVKKVFESRGYKNEDLWGITNACEKAALYGIRTHNVIKAVHLDDKYGSKVGGCTPNIQITKHQSKYKAVQKWDANKKHGCFVAYDALKTCIELADEYGIGTVVVNNAFHYLCGGLYVMEAARKGYIAYTNCTSTLAEVVPFKGKNPTLGTNPHSWAFPTTQYLGYPIVMDWASSKISFGRVAECKREHKTLPLDSAIDKDGVMTINPKNVHGLLPFGEHKGYSLALINELFAGFTGSTIPSLRGQTKDSNCSCFYFQVIKPDAIDITSSPEKIKNLLIDIKRGNPNTLFPGQLEQEFGLKSVKNGGFLFTPSEIEELNKIAKAHNIDPWDIDKLKVVE